jgi:dipeptidyl aminopeptidase/acylaminoacyl peptidase
MTDERSLERAARSWLEAGPTEAPDHAVDDALLRIQTTTQERDWHVPRRNRPMTTTVRLLVAAIALAVVAAGGVLVLRSGGGPGSAPSPTPTTTPPSTAPSTLPSAVPSSPAAARVDYSDLGGRILMEHLGNAPDLSEAGTTEYHPERRRLYLMEPTTMTGATAQQFVPGRTDGALSADVSPDGTKVVFQDATTSAQTSNHVRVYEAGVDGSGFRVVSTACSCNEYDPAYDPAGARIAFVHVEGAYRPFSFGANSRMESLSGAKSSWVGVRDLATGKVTKLDATVGTSTNAVPEQPSWSPDGTKIVFNRLTWDDVDVPGASVLQIVDVATGTVTDVAVGALRPGDADWSPDGSTILFTTDPSSAVGSIGGMAPDLYTVKPDGTGLRRLTRTGASGGSYLPDGRILFQANTFWIMNGDGTVALPVNDRASDLSDQPQGFAYISHFVPNP